MDCGVIICIKVLVLTLLVALFSFFMFMILSSKIGLIVIEIFYKVVWEWSAITYVINVVYCLVYGEFLIIDWF